MSLIETKQRVLKLIKEAEEQFSGTGKALLDIEDYVAEYLAANGVIVPPCKVGDTVFCIYKGEVKKARVFSLHIESEDEHWLYIFACKIFDGFSMFKKFIYGKTVFLAKEEAEKALAERSEGK